MKKILLLSSYLLATAAVANDSNIELEPMTIIAPATIEPPLNKEALSKNELYQQDVIERGINRVQDVIKNTPNFTLTNQGFGSFRQVFNVRGLVNTAIYGTPAVAFYIDDVAYGSAMSNMGALFDVDSVDIYRDSQPAKFGKNAYAGAIDIHTRQATNQLEGDIRFGVAAFNNYSVNARSSGALIKDKLYFNLGGVYQQSQGFLTNNYLNTHPDNQENFSGQATLTWKPSQAWDIRLNLSKEDMDYGSGRFTRVDSTQRYTNNSNVQEQLKQNTHSQSLRIGYQSDNYQLLSISSHRVWQMSPLVVDLDLTALPLGMRTVTANNETWTQEMRFSPKHQGIWDWQLTAFYANTDNHSNENFIAKPFTNDLSIAHRSIDNYALAGHLGYGGFDKLSVYQDLRLDYVTSHLNASLSQTNGGNLENKNYQTFFASPKWGFDYRFSKNNVLYASTGFGAKAGGLSYANVDMRFVEFKQENLWHNTLGIKSDWFNGRLSTNLSGFYYQIENYQIERFLINGNYTTFNAPQVTSYGFEIESRAKLVDNLYLENNVGHTHSEINRFQDLITGANYQGNPVPFVPEFNATTALQYKHPQGYFIRTEWLWRGKTYFDETKSAALSQNDYSLFNVRVGYSKQAYSVYLYADNLGDNYYYTSKIGVRGVLGNPRVVGAQLSVSF